MSNPIGEFGRGDFSEMVLDKFLCAVRRYDFEPEVAPLVGALNEETQNAGDLVVDICLTVTFVPDPDATAASTFGLVLAVSGRGG
jgi:hypothetical protein